MSSRQGRFSVSYAFSWPPAMGIRGINVHCYTHHLFYESGPSNDDCTFDIFIAIFEVSIC